MALVSSTVTKAIALVSALLLILFVDPAGPREVQAAPKFASAKVIPGSSTLLGYVDATALSKDWAGHYAPGLVFSHGFVKAGSSFTLRWQVLSSSGRPLANYPVTLQANKAYGGNSAHFAATCIDIPAANSYKDAADIFAETDKYGQVSFTITNLDAIGESASTPTNRIDQNSPSVFGQFSLQIGSLTDLQQTKEIVELHVLGSSSVSQPPKCLESKPVKSEYLMSTRIVPKETKISTPKLSDVAIGKLIWSDEFHLNTGQQPSSTFWTSRLCGTSNKNGGGIYCSGDQYYSKTASKIDSAGYMAIITTANELKRRDLGDCQAESCPFVSGRFDSQGKLALQYGYLEARVKMPSGIGQNPAFWLLGDNITRVGWPASGEIDVMEQPLIQLNQNAGSVHYSTSYSGCCDNHKTITRTFTGGQILSEDFHAYGILWTPGKITFYIDGVAYGSASRTDAQTNFWPFDAPAFLIFDNSTPGVKQTMTWKKSTMQIDYVRLWQADGYGAAWTH